MKLTRKAPERCAEYGHPGVTFNAWEGKTWCLCGAVVVEGDAVVTPHAACCGGPLEVAIVERYGKDYREGKP